MRVPHTRPGVWPEIAAARFAAGIERDVVAGEGEQEEERALARRGEGARAEPPSRPPEGTIAVLGLPDDTGVALNGGRVGAAEGPTAFRSALAVYGTRLDLDEARALDVSVVDAGDVVPAEGADENALLETHRRVTEAVRALHDDGLTVVCVGGGHDLTLASVRALAEHVAAAPGIDRSAPPLGGLNVDAHLDVRDEVGSGMPFRRLIEDGHVDPARFVTFGASRFVHAPEHVAWLKGKKGTVLGVAAARRDPAAIDHAFSLAFGSVLARPQSPGFVTVDLDAIDAAYAPGVSAFNPLGLDVATVTEIAERAGRTPGVRHFDVMELSPPHDLGGRTARVAALVFLHFVAGFLERGA